MPQLMLLAHLIGDYILQTNGLARWKARSLAGVLAHGGIVTVTAVVCTLIAQPGWWPYALLIGLFHTTIDLIRARLLQTRDSTWELIWYLADQVSHLAVIWLVTGWCSSFHSPIRVPIDGRMLALAIGYLLLAQPTWIFLRLMVRGLWGPHAAPALGQGEKFGPILERMLIATGVLVGQLYLVPLILLPRRLQSLRIEGGSVAVLVRPTGHWAETLLSILLAAAVGAALRTM